MARIRCFWSKFAKPKAKQQTSAQDKKLKKVEEKYGKGTVHDRKQGAGPGHDLYKKPNGDIVIKRKGEKGPGEPTGLNLRDIRRGR